MTRSCAYQYKLNLTDAQRQEIVRSAGCVRKVWNCFLAKIKKDEEKRKAKEKAKEEQAKLMVEASAECVTNGQSYETQDAPSEEQPQPSSQKKSKSVKTKSETKSKKKGSYKGFAHNCKVLTRLKAKESYAYLNDCPAQALQQTLKNMDKAFQRFFKKEAGYPVFKKKSKYKAIHFPQGYQLFPEVNGKGVIRLPKIGYVRYIAHRPIHPDFEIKNV